MKKSIFEMVQNALDLCAIHSHLNWQKNRFITTLLLVVSVFIVNAQPWNQLPITNTTTLGSNLLGIHFVDDSIGYVVGTGGTISKTTNGGVSWVSQTSNTNSSLYSTYFIDALTGFAVGDGAVIKRTDDGGTDWQKTITLTGAPLPNGTQFREVWFYNAYEGYIVGGVSASSGAILKTIDGGKNWANISPNPNNGNAIYGIFFTNAMTGYATDFDGRILTTTNGGTIWSVPTPISPNNNLHGIYFTSKDTGYVVGGNTTSNTGVILKTVNAGGSWLASGSATQFLTDVKFFGINGFAVGGNSGNNTNGVIYKNTPFTNLWTPQTIIPLSGTTVSRQYRVSLPCSHTGYSCGLNGTILKINGIGEKICCDSVYNYFSNVNFSPPTNVGNVYTFTKPTGTINTDILTWNFGDGQESTVLGSSGPVSHTYPSASNSYLVTLWIQRPQANGDTCKVKLCKLISTHPCPNLVKNGDFSLGNDGSFTTGLNTTPQCNSCVTNAYCIGNTFNSKCNLWPATFDHTYMNASGSFMSIDGNTTGGATDAWRTTVPIVVTPNTTYKFTFWEKAAFRQIPFNIQMEIRDGSTGLLIPGVLKLVAVNQIPTWTKHTLIWNSGSTASVILAIKQLSGTEQRDFGLDDISFTCLDCCDFKDDVTDFGIQSTGISGNTYQFCVTPNLGPNDLVQWDVDCDGVVNSTTSTRCTTFTVTPANTRICATVLHVIKPGDTCRAKVNDCLPNVQPMKPCSCDTAIFNSNVMAGFTWVKNSPYSITFTPIALLNNCDSIRWTFGNAGAIASSVGSASVTYTYPSVPGTYQVCMIVTRTEPSGKVCKKEFCLTIKLDGMTPTAEIALPNLTFKPNPTTNSVIITIPSTLNSKENVLRLSTIEGRIVKTISVESTETVMDLEILPAGLYFLSLIDNQGNMLTRPAKLVKQ